MKTDPRVDAYLARSPAFAQPILAHLRQLVHATCPEAGETMKWGSPFFTYQDQILCFFASFKAHLAFGFWHQKMQASLAADGRRKAGARGLMGRITRREDLPDDATTRRYLRTAMQLVDDGVPARTVRKAKASLPVPADLAAALKENTRAAAHWKNFAPGKRRDYVEWVTEAKRDATRTTRVATTVAWVAAGKSRNWKYENC